jgi:hypothetical protein
LLFVVVGFCDVLQHTPRAVTDELPCEVTLPPPEAELEVMLVIGDVVTVDDVPPPAVVNCQTLE